MDFEETVWSTHWEDICRRAAARPDVAEACLGELAKKTGLPWFDRLSDQRAGDYLTHDGRTILRLRGFGRTKRERLLAIIEANLQSSSDNNPPPATNSTEPWTRLAEWGVPDNYPSAALLRLPARVLRFCEQAKIEHLGDLVRLTVALGERGLLSRKNLGRKSVNNLLGLVDALRKDDHQEAARWLPLSENGPGLSLGVAIKQLIADLDARQRPLLERRLVQGMTLEDAARMFQVTRERVRQIARDCLLGPLQLLLDTFPAEQTELFRQWMTGMSPADHLGAFATPSDRALADGALRELFSGRPEAVAAKLDRELRFEQLQEKLRRSLDFHFNGVDLQAFLEQELPVEQHGPFMEFLFENSGFMVNHETGHIGPEKPSLRRLVTALLREEDDPVPATWLLDLCGRQTPLKPSPWTNFSGGIADGLNDMTN